MDLYTHGMSQPVAEIPAVARALDDVARGGVDRASADSAFGGGDARKLGFEHRAVDVFHLIRRFA